MVVEVFVVLSFCLGFDRAIDYLQPADREVEYEIGRARIGFEVFADARIDLVDVALIVHVCLLLESRLVAHRPTQ